MIIQIHLQKLEQMVYQEVQCLLHFSNVDFHTIICVELINHLMIRTFLLHLKKVFNEVAA
jgi:2-polyprenyl-3-methyl-5-hydroxy-6-metoxy-1,4-benzoquinol methylase